MKNSLIVFCDHSYAPWFVCSHDGPGCLNCYPEDWNRRFFPNRGRGQTGRAARPRRRLNAAPASG